MAGHSHRRLFCKWSEFLMISEKFWNAKKANYHQLVTNYATNATIADLVDKIKHATLFPWWTRTVMKCLWTPSHEKYIIIDSRCIATCLQKFTLQSLKIWTFLHIEKSIHFNAFSYLKTLIWFTFYSNSVWVDLNLMSFFCETYLVKITIFNRV